MTVSEFESDTSTCADDGELAVDSTDAFSKTKLVYLVRRESLSSVFLSQVIRPMSLVAESGVDVEIAVLTPLGQIFRKPLRNRWADILAAVPTSLVGRVHRLPTPPSRMVWPWFEHMQLARYLRRRTQPGQLLIVQCRNSTATQLALHVKRWVPDIRVVFDCRGVLDHEFLYKHGVTYDSAPESLRNEAAKITQEQQIAAVQSDAVFCVSESMVCHLIQECGIAKEKCVVVPCCVDVAHFAQASERRDEMRQRLGLDQRFVVTYCGSLASYQMPEESIELFCRIKRIEPKAHFLAITTQPIAMEAAVRAAELSSQDATVVSVPHRQVAAYLAAADVGLLLRKRSPVNRVASPVKFGEYLASGTPVILSDEIGDYSKLAPLQRVGMVLNSDWPEALVTQRLQEFLQSYASSTSEWRCRCQQTAHRHLDFANHLPKIRQTYGIRSNHCLQPTDHTLRCGNDL